MLEKIGISSSERTLPINLNAERATLGSVLLERDAVIVVAPWLLPEHFYLEKHAWIYEAMLACYGRRVPPDLSTVADELRRHERLDLVGGVLYLTELSDTVPTAVHVEYYARIVERAAIRRRLIEAGGKIAAYGYDESEELEITLDKAESELFNVSQRRGQQDFVHVRSVLDAYFDQINRAGSERGELVGVPTGYLDLDRLTGGLQRSDLIILAARPSVGKTAFALSIAYNMAVKNLFSVAVFSLEMSREQLVQRLLAMHTGIDTQRLRTGTIGRDVEQVIQAMGTLSDAELYIEDTPGLSITEVRNRARRLRAQAPVDLVVVDYLQLMQGRRNDNRVQEVSEISRGLKALARELDVPVLALSQLSRAVEGRMNHIPMLSDLRESGCLTGDTLVYLPDQGMYQRIDSLVGQCDFNVLAVNTETWKLEPRSVLKAFATGRKPVYRLTTRLGRSIRATGNHKFLTVEGWKRLDELGAGRHLALPRRLPTTVQASLSNAQLALLGHLIGDGCTLPRHAIQYTTNELILAETVVALATDVFGETIRPAISQERTWYQVYLSANQHLTHHVRNPVAAWLDELGIFGLRSHEKFIPDAVFTQPTTSIAIFLRHLWATDGCVQLVAGKNVRPIAYYATSSKLLAQHVQSLLLRIGISARLACTPQVGKGRDQYHVTITGKTDVLAFLDVLGTIGVSKQRQEAAIRAHVVQTIANTNRDIIPREVWRTTVVPAMHSIGMTTRQMHAAINTRYCGTALYKQNISRERAERVALAVQSPGLLHLAHSDVYWDEIIAIEPDGEEDVYDLTVEGWHNFVANNIIVHNSIEQDADIVMFIYREELYDKETDKKGIAEIHLAKHRNGPLGVVPLRFENRTTTFQNLARYSAPEGY